MNTKRKFQSLSVIAALALILSVLSVGSVSAGSGSPIIWREEVDHIFTTGFCGFPMEVHSTGTGVFHLFLDEAGNFERGIITGAETKITFTNLETGYAVWTPSVNMTEEIANEDGTGTKTLRGLLWHLVVPGEGLLTADVGRIDFLFTLDEQGNVISEEVVFLAGQQEGEFIPMLCSVLKPAQ